MTLAERAEIKRVIAALDELAGCRLTRRDLEGEIMLYAARLDQLLQLGPPPAEFRGIE